MNSFITRKCAFCNQDIDDSRKSKFCSDKCRHKIKYYSDTSKANKSTYESQKKRALLRKLELIRLAGNKCNLCGYNKNIAALEFHHNDPSNKNIKLDSRVISNTKWSSLVEELSLCTLLCANCHRDLHNPDSRNLL
jgi:predicted nucleic acid-binding Zn ribbon protein